METALVKIENDILLAIDEQQCVIILLLDLSAAFNTVDHPILLNCIKTRLWITDQALEWIASYFEDRKQTVLINRVNSKVHILTCNVPQGSVLGPKFFISNESPLGEIIRSHGLSSSVLCRWYATLTLKMKIDHSQNLKAVSKIFNTGWHPTS